jgi:hypothetical protein
MIEYLVIIVTGAILISSIIWHQKRKGYIMTPLAFVGVICFLVQVVGPIYWKITGQRNYYGVPIMDYIIAAEFIFILGYLCLWFAYIWYKPGSLKVRGKIISNNTTGYSIDFNIRFAYIMFIVCFVLYSIYIVYRGKSMLSQLTLGQMGDYFDDIMVERDVKILFLSLSLNMIITCANIILFSSKSKLKYILYVVTMLLVISSGKRHLMLDAAIAPLIINYRRKERNPNFFVFIIGVVISYLLVGWIGAMRSVYRTGEGALVAFNSKDAWTAIMYNLDVFMVLCMYIPGLNSLDSFAYGTTYINSFIQLIPTFILPFKHELISILTIGNANDVLSQFLSAGIAGTFWSLLYANGWLIGVCIGMATLGVWLKKLEQKPESKRLSYLVEYGIVTSFMFQLLTRSFGNALQDYIGLILPLFFLRRFYFIKRKSFR